MRKTVCFHEDVSITKCAGDKRTIFKGDRLRLICFVCSLYLSTNSIFICHKKNDITIFLGEPIVYGLGKRYL